jgi:hypothetical protein
VASPENSSLPIITLIRLGILQHGERSESSHPNQWGEEKGRKDEPTQHQHQQNYMM